MENTLLRAGRSAVLNMARDFSCSIITGDNRLLATAEGLPVHVIGGERLGEAMTRRHPDLREGDAFLHNDPYAGNTHAADHTLMVPVFVEQLDAWKLQQRMGLELPPIMIYGDDVSHIVTEEGIANLLLCRTQEEREQAIRGVAGFTPVGMARDRQMVEQLRRRGVIRRAEDLGIDPCRASRDLLSARSIKDLVRWSGGLYAPPARFRNW
jgi:hypothetical protein